MKFLRYAERKFDCKITLDGASDYGVRRRDYQHNFLPYISRYNDGGNSFLNFLSVDFSLLMPHIVWLFPPKSLEVTFLSYFLNHKQRPGLILLLLQHQVLPSVYNFAKINSDRHVFLSDNNYLSRAVKGKKARLPHPFKGLLHLFYFSALSDK